MARRAAHAPLRVHLNTRFVGLLTKDPGGAIAFAYDRDWLAADNATPVSLSMPLREERFIGAAVAAVFDNLLPDSAPLRRRIAERVGAAGDDAFSLLSAIGRDCVGALQFLPGDASPGDSAARNSAPVTDKAVAEMLKSLSAAPLGLRSAEPDFRISIAGAQEKTALLQWRGGWRLPKGATPTTHIFKPQIGKLPNGVDMSRSVENEFFCMRAAQAFGLPAAEVEMADFEDVRTLVVTRFDRLWRNPNEAIRLPQEDFCQALGISPTLKYQSDGGPGARALLNLLRASDEPDTDRATFFKAQVLFWLLGATDGHAKNFSLFLGPSGSFRMTPLYDILSAQPAVNAGQIRRNQFKLAMSFGDSGHYPVAKIMARHLAETGSAAGMSAVAIAAIFEQIRETAPKALDAVCAAMPPDFPAPIADGISAAARKRAARLVLKPE